MSKHVNSKHVNQPEGIQPRIRARGVVRVDTRATHGWQIRVYAAHSTIYTRLYSDAKFGGALGSFEAAKAGLAEAEPRIRATINIVASKEF